MAQLIFLLFLPDLTVPEQDSLIQRNPLVQIFLFREQAAIPAAVDNHAVLILPRMLLSVVHMKVSVFSIETAGLMDLDSELEMYFPGVGRVHFDFTGNSDIRAIGQAIGRYVLQ